MEFDSELQLKDGATFVVNRVRSHHVLTKTVDIHIQPLFDLNSVTCIGGEILARGFHNEETISPELFISRLENNGGIHTLGMHVIERAFNFIATSVAPSHRDWLFGLNISPVQLNQSTFTGELITLAKRCGIDPHTIMLEISHSEHKLSGIGLTNGHDLRAHGFRLAWDNINSMDDIYQTQAQLRSDYLKIDRSCLKTLAQVRAQCLIEKAQELGCEVIIEGVETWSQTKFLLKHGVTLGQGYLLSRPLDKPTFQQRYVIKKS